MIIRRAHAQDADQIGSLWFQLSVHHQPFHEYYRVKELGEQELVRHVRDLIQRDCVCFVAEDEDTLLGFVTGYIVRRNPQLIVEKIGKVDNIFVSPDFRRKKVGSSLLTTLFDFFKGQGVGFVEISCDIQNQDAMKLYKRLGFEEQKVLLVKSLN